VPVFRVLYDSNMARGADMAANVGNHRSQQDQIDNGLRFDANARADTQQAIGLAQAIAQDRRQREINAANNRRMYDLQDLRGDQRLEQIGVTEAGRDARQIYGNDRQDVRLGMRQEFQGQQNDANRLNQRTIAGQRVAVTARGQDIGNENADLKRQQDAAQFEQRRKDDEEKLRRMERLRQLEASRRAEAAAGRMTAQRQQAYIEAQLENLNDLRRINESRAGMGDMTAAREIELLNDAINKKMAELMGGGGGASPQPSPGGAVGGGGLDAQTMQTGQPPAPVNPLGAAAQAMEAVVQQVAQEMPTASREAKRLEIKSRLMRQGIDPSTLGVR